MIKFDNVSKVYKNKKIALNEVSLEIEPGEFVYIVGHSGAGKSTFLRLLYRQEKATKGKITVADKDLSKIRYGKVQKYRRDVGFVFQDFQLLPNRTTFENIAYAMEVRGASRAEIRERVNETLELVGLLDKAKQYPSQLSGGEQQRVAIARSIVNEPKILIADEPTGNLDPVTSRTIMDVLDAINDLGKTVVVATHDQFMVNSHPKRTITFKNGIIFNDSMTGGYIVGDDDFDQTNADEQTETESVLTMYETMEEQDLIQQEQMEADKQAWDNEVDDSLYETFSQEIVEEDLHYEKPVMSRMERRRAMLEQEEQEEEGDN